MNQGNKAGRWIHLKTGLLIRAEVVLGRMLIRFPVDIPSESNIPIEDFIGNLCIPSDDASMEFARRHGWVAFNGQLRKWSSGPVHTTKLRGLLTKTEEDGPHEEPSDFLWKEVIKQARTGNCDQLKEIATRFLEQEGEAAK